QTVDILTIDETDHVAAAESGVKRGRTGDRAVDDHPVVVVRPDFHTNAVVLAALAAHHFTVVVGVDKVGVRVQGVQHLRDGALVDGFVGGNGVGVILLDQSVNRGDRFDVGGDVVRAGSGCLGSD